MNYFISPNSMIPIFLLGYSLFTANFSVVSPKHSNINENDSINVSLSGILSTNQADGLSSSENDKNNNQSFGTNEIRPKRDEDDDTPLHDDEEIEKSDISSFNSSDIESPWNNSKEKNINVKKRSPSKIINSSEKKQHQQHKREVEEISKGEKDDETEITSNNESGSVELKNVGETSGQQEGEEIKNETMKGRNTRSVGGLAHRSRGAGQKGQQKSQAGRGPKSEEID